MLETCKGSWEYSGAGGKVFQEVHPWADLGAGATFRQEGGQEKGAVFRVEDSREKNQRERKIVKFCLCGRDLESRLKI